MNIKLAKHIFRMNTIHFFKPLLILCICFLSITCLAQNDTIYYNKKWKATVKDSAAFFRPPLKKEGDFYKAEDFYISGKLQMSGLSTSSEKDFWEGKVTWFNEDGSILQQGNYKNNRLEGEYLSLLGGRKLKGTFENGRMVSGATNGKINDRQYFTQIKGDTTISIIYENDIKGVRYERYNIGDKYDAIIKYFDNKGALIGQRESLPDGNIVGVVVSYYKTPMRPMEIQYYPNGKKIGSSFYYCKDQVREEFKSEDELSKTFYNPQGGIIGKVQYEYDNNYLKPVSGTEYTFFSSYKEYKGELIKSIREYSNGKLQYEKLFYENQKIKSETNYKDGGKELQVSYDENGKEIARMTYTNWNPLNGTEIIGNRSITYKDSKLIEEVNRYYDTQIIFNRKTPNTETYYDKNGEVLGILNLEDDNGYLKPMNGTRFMIDYDGDIQSKEVYKNGFITERTNYRKRQVGENKTVIFKKIELFEANGYKRTKEVRFYSNGNKQSEISYAGYKETKGVFYNDKGDVIGAYDYEIKEGKLYEFFGDSDKLKRMEVREDGKQIKLKRYDYGLNAKYGAIHPVLIQDIDVSCCASFYARDGKLLGKVTFKGGIPWEGQLYNVDQRTRYALKEGKRNGLYEKLDYNQNVVESGNFVNDKKEGHFSIFHYDGQLLTKELFKNNFLEGVARYYDKAGELIGTMTYKTGQPFNGTRATKPSYNTKAGVETYENGELIKRVFYDDNGKRITKYIDRSKTETTAYYGDTDVKRLSYTVKGNNLDGLVISYDKEGKEQYSATLTNGKLKDGILLITGGNVRGNPAYIILNRKPDTLTVKFMGQNDKVLFTAEENLAFGTATVFMQSLDVYMDYLGPERLY